MSVRRPPGPSSHLVLAALLAVLALGGSACSSSNNNGGGGTDVDIQTVLDLVVLSGNDIAGLQVELTYGGAVRIIDVMPTGPNIGGTCEANVGTNFASLACLGRETYDAPETVWFLTFAHTVTQRPLDNIISLDCSASDELGVVVPVQCELR